MGCSVSEFDLRLSLNVNNTNWRPGRIGSCSQKMKNWKFSEAK